MLTLVLMLIEGKELAAQRMISGASANLPFLASYFLYEHWMLPLGGTDYYSVLFCPDINPRKGA